MCFIINLLRHVVILSTVSFFVGFRVCDDLNSGGLFFSSLSKSIATEKSLSRKNTSVALAPLS